MSDSGKYSMENVSLEQLEKFMDNMGVFLPSEDVSQLMSNERMKVVLATVIKCITSEEKVKHARRHLLLSHILTESTDKCNQVNVTSRRLELIKKYVKLKSKLVEREKEIEAKRREFWELDKHTEELIQDIQLTDCAIDEERKKELFMLLNKKELQSMSHHWKSLQKDVSELKETLKLKSKKENCQESKTTEVKEVLDDCKSFIAVVQKEIEDEKPSSSCSSLKHKMKKYVNKHLQNFSWEAIFGALLQQQDELNKTMETFCKNTSDTSTIYAKELDDLNPKVSQKAGFNEACNKMVYELFMKELRFCTRNEGENVVPKEFPVDSVAVSEELKSVTSHINVIDRTIQEKIEEFRCMKGPLREKLEEINQIRSRIKQFPVLLEKSIIRSDNLEFSLDKLQACMNQLTSTSLEEIKLFSEIPLVFLEKVQLLSGGCGEGPKLLFNHQKLHPYFKEYSKPSLTLLNGTPSLTPFDIVLHLFQQLGYLGALSKAECMLKPVSEPSFIVPFKMDLIMEGNEKIQEIYSNFVSALSFFESTIYEIAESLHIMRNHPLMSVVPKDFVVEGTTLEYWENELTNYQNSWNNPE